MAAAQWVSASDDPRYWEQYEPEIDPQYETVLEDPPTLNGDQPHVEVETEPKPAQLEIPTGPIIVESWAEFTDKASDHIPCLVEGLWPEGSLGFIASPPKKGKTWLGLSLGLSIALGKQYLAEYDVKDSQPILYLALEGHRSGLMHRMHALCRGLDTDPDKNVENFHIAYKPRGINIASPQWAEYILTEAERLQAVLVVVDVLRAAARMKENEASDFSDLRANLSPLLDDGHSIALLHHFVKLSDISKDRDPGERMSGSGAMYGGLDVGVYITGSELGARKLRIEYDGRDMATPDPAGIYLEGEGSGINGGFTHRDKAWWRPSSIPEEDNLKVPTELIADYVRSKGGDVPQTDICAEFEISKDTLGRRAKHLTQYGIQSKKISNRRYFTAPDLGGQDEL